MFIPLWFLFLFVGLFQDVILKVWRKTIRILNQESRWPNWDYKHGPPERESEVLLLEQLVWICLVCLRKQVKQTGGGFSDVFPIQKRREDLSPLILNFALGPIIRKVLEIWLELVS
jgi:hypothetical protein